MNLSNVQNHVYLNFGQALEEMKAGGKVARIGWNGQGMYAFLVHGHEWTFTNGKNDNFPHRPFMVLKTAQNDIASWVPSGSDILAEDWIVFE